MNTTDLIASIDAEIARLQSARNLLTESVPSEKGLGRPKGSKNSSTKTATKTAGKRTFSAEARAKIAAAQKARWAVRTKAK